MSGIRILNVPKTAEERHLRIHFSKRDNNGGHIDTIYYPLNNNDAVIVYKDAEVVDRILKIEHRLLSSDLQLQRIPENMVFSSLEAKLGQDVSVLILATPNLHDQIKYGENIEMTEAGDQTLSLRGNWYQLEWAWHMLDCIMQQQEVIHNDLQQSEAGMETSERDRRSDVIAGSSSLSSSAARREQPVSHEVSADRRRASETVSPISPHSAAKASRSDIYADEMGASAADRYSSLPSNFLDSDRQQSRYNGSGVSNGTTASHLKSLKRNIGLSYMMSDEEDTDDELQKIGHFSLADSLTQTLSGDYGRKRISDENDTFEKFSSLQLDTDKVCPGSMKRTPSVSPPNYPSDTYAKSQYKTDYDGERNKFASLPVDLNDRHGNRGLLTSIHDTAGYQSLSRHSTLRSDHSLVSKVNDISRDRTRFSPTTDNSTSQSPRGTDTVAGRSLTNSFSTETNHGHKSLPLNYSRDELMFSTTVKGIKVTIYHGNLLSETTEAIVNAANNDLEHNGGIALAIANARGAEIKRECREYIQKHGKLKTGDAMKTSGGGRVAATYIFHAVGPIWFDALKESFPRKLTQTFLSCFNLAENMWLKTIALPAISTGVYGAPLDECMKAFLYAILVFSKDSIHLRDIRMLNNDAENAVMSIVLLKTLLESGLDDLMSQAVTLMRDSPPNRDLNIPRGRQERSGSFSRTYTKPVDTGSSRPAPSRRSSSHSRITDRSMKDKTSPSTSYNLTGYSSRSTEAAAASPRDSRSTKGYLSERDHTSHSSGTFDRKTLFNRSVSSSHSDTTKSSKRPATTGTTSRTAPQIKQSLLLDSVKSKPFKSHRSDYSSSRSNDPLSAHSPKSTPSSHTRPRYYNNNDDDSDFGMQSLPAKFETQTFREKYLNFTSSEDTVDVCAICLSEVQRPKELSKCKHRFCTPCIDEHWARSKPTCPTCGMIYGVIKGDQPRGGQMSCVTKRDLHLPGYERVDGTIVITYTFRDGIQDSSHPNPGKPYKGMERKAYLPNNVEGRAVMRLLKKAFDSRLVFTIGSSRTTGKEGVITWNDIHHKTSIKGGPTKFGYPDSDYLKRVKEELALKGVVSDSSVYS